MCTKSPTWGKHLDIEDLTNIRNVTSWDSGGGILLDLIELRDGRVLAISEDVIVLYGDMDDLVSGDASKYRPSIPL